MRRRVEFLAFAVLWAGVLVVAEAPPSLAPHCYSMVQIQQDVGHDPFCQDVWNPTVNATFCLTPPDRRTGCIKDPTRQDWIEANQAITRRFNNILQKASHATEVTTNQMHHLRQTLCRERFHPCKYNSAKQKERETQEVEVDFEIDAFYSGDLYVGDNLMLKTFVSNEGTLDASGATVTVEIPSEEFIFVQVVHDTETIDATVSGTTVTFTTGTICSYCSVEYLIDIMVPYTTAAGEYSFDFSISDARDTISENNHYTLQAPLTIPQADLSIFMEVVGGIVSESQATLKVEYANYGSQEPAPASLVAVTMPSGSTFLSAEHWFEMSSAQAIAITPSSVEGTKLTFDMGTIPGWGDGYLFVTCRMPTLSQGSALEIPAEISSPFDVNPSNNVMLLDTSVFIGIGLHDTYVEVEHIDDLGGAEGPSAGYETTYSVEYGLSDDSNVPVTDGSLHVILPAHATLVGDPVYHTCSAPSVPNSFVNEGADADNRVHLKWTTLGVIPPSDFDACRRWIHISARIDASVSEGAPAVFEALIEPHESDIPNSASSHAILDEVVVPPIRNPTISISIYSWDPYAVGYSVKFKSVIRNQGSVPANLRLTNTLPQGCTYTNQYTYEPWDLQSTEGNVVVWTRTERPSGASAVYVTCEITDTALRRGDVIQNEATVVQDGVSSSDSVDVVIQSAAVEIPTTLDMGTVFIGYTTRIPLVVKSDGEIVLLISAVDPSSGLLTLEGDIELPLSILQQNAQLLSIAFNPDATGTFQGSVVLTTNVPDQETLTVTLQASVVDPPQAALSSTEDITATLQEDHTDTTSVHLLNSAQAGASPLMFRLARNTLEDILHVLYTSYEGITTAIPHRNDFMGGGGTAAYIGRDVSDMYDTGYASDEYFSGGNYLRTEIGANILYSDGAVVEGNANGIVFPTDKSRYFTLKVPAGLFVFAADLDNVQQFGVYGGVEGYRKLMETNEWDITRNDMVWRVFVKQTYSDMSYTHTTPSVIHVFLTEKQSGLMRSVDTSQSCDTDVLSGLQTSTKRIYYLLFSAQRGSYIPRAYVEDIVQRFLWVTGATHLQETWWTATPSSGQIAPTSSGELSVTLDATHVDGHDIHRDTLRLFTNDPTSPEMVLGLNLGVNGDPVLTLVDDSVVIPLAFVGHSFATSVTLRNDGPGDLSVTALSFNPASVLSVSGGEESFVVLGFTEHTISVIYTPDSTGTLSGTMSITSNAAGASTVNLEGEAQYPPVIAVDPIAIERTLESGAQVDVLVEVSNTGVTGAHPLEYTCGWEREGKWKVGVYRPTEYEYLKTIPEITQNYELEPLNSYTDVEAIQSYDAIIIRESDHGISREEAMALVAFVEGGGGLLLSMDDFDDLSTDVKRILFPIMGVLSADDGEYTPGFFASHPLTSGLTNPVEDLSDSENDYFELNGARPILFGGDGNAYVIANEHSGRVVVFGETLGSWYDAENGLDLIHACLNWIVAWRAILNPLSGSVQPGSVSTITVSLDARGLVVGDYASPFTITSNDPSSPAVIVDVTLHVQGTPEASVTPELMNFGVMHQGTSSSFDVTIFNAGATTLIIQSANTPATLTLDLATPVEIVGFGQCHATITWLPTAGDPNLDADIVLHTNDPAHPALAVRVQGTSVPVPVIDVKPVLLGISLGADNQVAQTNLLVRNTGTGTLDFTFSTYRDYRDIVDSFSPAAGLLEGVGVATSTVTFNSRDSSTGTRNPSIIVESNDPATPSISIPIRVTIYELPPGKPYDPRPQDGQENVAPSYLELEWTGGVASVFDVYVWTGTGSRPSTPQYADVTRFKVDMEQVNDDTLYSWQVVAKNSMGTADGDVWTFTTQKFADVRVDASQIEIPSSVFSGQEMVVSWQVTNHGSAPTPSTWNDCVYISTSSAYSANLVTKMDQVRNAAYLDAGESYASTSSFEVPVDIHGSYFVYIRTDCRNRIRGEPNEEDNYGRSPSSVTIELSATPDLVVTALTPPTNAFSGDEVPLSFTVTNNGEGTSPETRWRDYVYLAGPLDIPPDTIDEATCLDTIRHTGVLTPGDSYEVTTTVTLAQMIHGKYWILVMADGGNSVFEGDGGTENNVFPNPTTTNPTATNIALRPPPDLVASCVEKQPVNGTSGKSVTLSWTVQNRGLSAPFERYWYDRILLLRADEPSFERYIAKKRHYNPSSSPLQPEDSYTTSKSITIPLDLPTAFYTVSLETDYYDQVFETDDTNNVNTATTLFIQQEVADLVIDMVAPSNLLAGALAHFSWTVTNTGSDRTNGKYWDDQLYVGSAGGFEASDPTLLHSLRHSGRLEAGDSYTESVDIMIPLHIFGTTLAFYGRVDTDEDVYEGEDGEENNVCESSVVITQTPTINLVPLSLEAPSVGVRVGAPVTISWTVRNQGNDIAAPPWNDALYLLPDGYTYPHRRILLGEYEHQLSLPSDDSYTETRTTIIPNDVATGRYVFNVNVDSGEAIFEHNGENDNALGLVSSVLVGGRPETDLTVSDLAFPTHGDSGKPLSIVFSVINNGPVATLATSWIDAAYLSRDTTLDPETDMLVAEWTHVGGLASGASYEIDASPSLPHGIEGTWFLLIVVDSKNSVVDNDRINNIAFRVDSPLQVTQSPAANLVVSVSSTPETLTAGQPVTVLWTVTNMGAGIAETSDGRWFDSVLLSSDPFADKGDTILGAVEHRGVMNPEDTYTQSLSVDIYSEASGQYYLIVQTDSRNDVWESEEEQDNLIAWIVQVTVSPPVDLVVVDIEGPSQAAPGDVVVVNYKVKNIGTNDARGQLCDAIFMSSDENWNIDDPRMTDSCFHADISREGGVLPRSTSSMVPSLAPGTHYEIVSTNIRNTINEGDRTNNEGTGSESVEITVSEVPFNARTVSIPSDVDVALDANQYRLYRVTVPAGVTAVLVTLKSNVPTAFNELYIRFQEPPTRGTFDFSHQNSLSANQEAVIPKAEEGTYYILLYCASLGGGSDQMASLVVRELSFEIRRVSPTVGGQNGEVTVRLDGGRIRPNVRVFLETNVPTERVEAKATYWEDSSTVYATFDLTGVSQETHNIAMEQNEDVIIVDFDDETASDCLAASIQENGPLELHTWCETNDDCVAMLYNLSSCFVRKCDTGDASDHFCRLSLSSSSACQSPTCNVVYTQDLDGGRILGVEDSGKPMRTVLMGVFVVEAPQANRLDIRTLAPRVVRPGKLFEYSIDVSNNGINDLPAEVLVAFGLPNVAMYVTGYDSMMGEGYRLIYTASPSGPPDVISPGMHLTIRIAVRASDSSTLLRLVTRQPPQTNIAADLYREFTHMGVDNSSSVWQDAIAAVAQEMGSATSWDAFTSYIRLISREERVRSLLCYDVLFAALGRALSPALEESSEDQARRQLLISTEPWQEPVLSGPVHWMMDRTACYVDSLVENRVVLTVVAIRFPETGQSHLLHFLYGDGSPIFHGPNTLISRYAKIHDRAKRSWKSIHNELKPGIRANLMITIKNDGRTEGSLPDIPFTSSQLSKCHPDFYTFGIEIDRENPAFDLITAFGGFSQPPAGAVTNIHWTEVSPAFCGVGSILGYKATVHYEFNDYYAFDSRDALSSGFDRAARDLQLCGWAKPFYTQLIVEEEVTGKVVLNNGRKREDIFGLDPNPQQCEDPDPDPGEPFDDVPVVRPVDPNDIVGPVGYGDAHWIPVDLVMPFTINFENDPDLATAPAQKVVIVQTLDSDRKITSFRVGSFGFDSHVISVPEGRAFYQTYVKKDPNTEEDLTVMLDDDTLVTIWVEFLASINVLTNEIRFVLQTIDPTTGLPPTDVRVGFLPINDENGRGEGFVSYTIEVEKPGTTGHEIVSHATITFDSEAEVDTPRIINTLDAAPPTSDLTVTEVDGTPDTLLSWTASDDGSGVAGVRVYVAEDDGALNLWRGLTREEGAVFNGGNGHTYRFFTQAVDNTGLEEALEGVSSDRVVSTEIRVPGVPSMFVMRLQTRRPSLWNLAVNEDAVFVAHVEDIKGAPVKNAVVSFATSHGTLSPSRGVTDATGELVSTLTGIEDVPMSQIQVSAVVMDMKETKAITIIDSICSEHNSDKEACESAGCDYCSDRTCATLCAASTDGGTALEIHHAMLILLTILSFVWIVVV